MAKVTWPGSGWDRGSVCGLVPALCAWTAGTPDRHLRPRWPVGTAPDLVERVERGPGCSPSGASEAKPTDTLLRDSPVTGPAMLGNSSLSPFPALRGPSDRARWTEGCCWVRGSVPVSRGLPLAVSPAPARTERGRHWGAQRKENVWAAGSRTDPVVQGDGACLVPKVCLLPAFTFQSCGSGAGVP